METQATEKTPTQFRQMRGRRKRRTFTDEEKTQILSAINEGLTLGEISRRSGVSVQNLRRWKKEGFFELSSYEKTSQANSLKRENAFLKDLLFKVLKHKKAA